MFFYKLAKNKGDHLWWITEKKTDSKFTMLVGISKTEHPGYPDIVIYKMYLGPLVIGVGLHKKEKK